MPPSTFDRRSFIAFAAGAATHVVTTGAEAPAAEGSTQRNVPPSMPSVDDLLWLLPGDIEGLLVSRAQIPIERRYSGLKDDGRIRPTYLPPGQTDIMSGEIDEFPNGVAALGADPFWNYAPNLSREEVTYRLMQRYFKGKLKLVLIAARNANMRRMSRNERCSFVVFRDPVGSEVMEEWARFPSRRHTISGHSVMQFDLRDSPDAFWVPRYAALTMPNTILASNSLDMLNTVLERLERRPKNRALPESLPEWEHVDTSAEAWGLRHYAPASWKSDPFSMPQYDPQGQGMAIFSDDNPPNSVVLRYISAASDAEVAFSRMMKKCHGPVAGERTPITRTGANRLEAKLIAEGDPEGVFPLKPLTIQPQYGRTNVLQRFGPLLGIC